MEDLDAQVAQEGEGGPLRKLYCKMLPYLDINQNIKSGWRHLHSSLSGIGLRKLPTEVVIGRINLYPQHYNTPSIIWTKLSISLQCLQLEAGSNYCQLLTTYRPIGPLTTPSWVRSFWKAFDHCEIKWILTILYNQSHEKKMNYYTTSSANLTLPPKNYSVSTAVILHGISSSFWTWQALMVSH